MATFQFPSSFRCDCGHEVHFFESTVREMQKDSGKSRRPMIIDDGSDHGVEFQGGRAVAVHCPKMGRCGIENS